jgi:AcrR family transcriptional regulator
MPDGPPDSTVKLPPALETLWGRRTAGSRGPRAELDVDRIVAAAIDIANADGLEGVSMARVATALGFTTMSLYRHVANKDVLLQLMWNASARGIGDLELEGTTWRERIRSWALVQRRTIAQNPWIVQLPMSVPPLSPDSLAWVELGLAALADVEVADAAKLRLIGLISQHALIDARMGFDEKRGREQAEELGVETDYAVLVRELADPAVYPNLTRIVLQERPASSDPEADREAEFDFDLTLMLDGFEALLKSPRRRKVTR